MRCRFFNSFGPGEVPGPYRNVIPNFIWRALHDEPLAITGTGDETRDFIYVDDLVDGLVRAGRTDAAHGEAINLGTGRQTRVIDLARAIIELRDRAARSGSRRAVPGTTAFGGRPTTRKRPACSDSPPPWSCARGWSARWRGSGKIVTASSRC